MNKISVALLSTLFISGCGSSDPVTPPEPQVALPLDQLVQGDKLDVIGNHTGIWRHFDAGSGDFVFTNNVRGPKLQRLNPTGNPNEYTAVFRNNRSDAAFDYGSATFTMPAAGGPGITATTDAGYEFVITRTNDALIYTLTGLYQIQIGTEAPLEQKYAFGGFAAGSITPQADLPTTGNFGYSGDFIGQSTYVGQVVGDFDLAVDFSRPAGDDISGSITNLTGEEGNIDSDLLIRAEISAIGQFQGIVRIENSGAGDNQFVHGDQFTQIDGEFFGPTAEEVGGTLRVNSVDHFLTGSFGGAQD